MDSEDFDAWDRRIRKRADLLWSQQGSPDGPRDRFLEEARELIAIEENPTAGHIDPLDAAEPVVEEAELMRNLGEFPTLTDQGDERTYPDTELESDPDTDRGIHLSDGDSSDEGGVLPEADLPDEDFADVASSDADLSSATFGSDQSWPSGNADINEDGFPDEPSLDDEDDEDEDEDDDEEDDDEEDDEDEDDGDDDEDDLDDEDDIDMPDDDDPDGDRDQRSIPSIPAYGAR